MPDVYDGLTQDEAISATEQNGNWDALETKADAVDGRVVLSGLTLSAGTGLQALVAAGSAVLKKAIEFDAITVNAIPPSTTTYLWLNADGTVSQTASTTPPVGQICVLLGSVTTDGSSVTGANSGIAWKGARVESDYLHVTGPNALTVAHNAAQVAIGTQTFDSVAALTVSGQVKTSALKLPEGSAPTLIANTGFLYTKDTSGATELYYMDDDGTELQLTDAGHLKAGFFLPLGGGTMTGLITLDDLGVLFASHGGAGAPASGTWADGQLVADSAGDLYLCTTAGTPGTWKKVSTAADLAAYLPLAGGTMAGAIAMGSSKITGLAAGTATGDAARYDELIKQSIQTFSNNMNENSQIPNTTVYNNLNGYRPASGTEANGQTILYDYTYTAKNLRCYSSTNSLTTATTTIRLRDDLANTSLVCTFAAGVSGEAADTSNTATIAAGSKCNYSVACASGGAGSFTTTTLQVMVITS